MMFIFENPFTGYQYVVSYCEAVALGPIGAAVWLWSRFQ